MFYPIFFTRSPKLWEVITFSFCLRINFCKGLLVLWLKSLWRPWPKKAGYCTLGVWTIKCSVMSRFTLVCGYFVSKLVDRGVDISDQDLARDVVSKVQYLDGDLDHVNNTWIKISSWRSSYLTSSSSSSSCVSLAIVCFLKSFPEERFCEWNLQRNWWRERFVEKIVIRQIANKKILNGDLEIDW